MSYAIITDENGNGLITRDEVVAYYIRRNVVRQACGLEPFDAEAQADIMIEEAAYSDRCAQQGSRDAAFAAAMFAPHATAQ